MSSWWNYFAILWPPSLLKDAVHCSTETLEFMRSHSLIVVLIAGAIVIPFRKSFLCQWVQDYCPFLYYQDQYIWFYIKSLWLIWVMICAGWYRFICILLHATVQILKIVSYFYCEFLDILNKKSGVHRCVDLCLCLQLKAIHQCICFYDNFIQFLLL